MVRRWPGGAGHPERASGKGKGGFIFEKSPQLSTLLLLPLQHNLESRRRLVASRNKVIGEDTEVGGRGAGARGTGPWDPGHGYPMVSPRVHWQLIAG